MPIPSTQYSDRLTLRAVEVEDASETYCAWLADPEVNQYLETRHADQTIENIRDFIRAKAISADEFLFAICRKEDGHHIGNIKLGPMRAAHKLAEVSLFIGDRDFWRGGYGSEAIRCVTDYAFSEQDLNKVTASLYAPNAGSERAFLKAGWTKEAMLPRHYILDAEPTDLVIMGLCRDDWTAASR